MTQYEINKLAYQNVQPIKDIQAMRTTIEKFLHKHKSNFYMLLSNENRYYTVFHWKQQDKIHQLKTEIVDIVTELGPVKDIVDNEDTGALEFWIDYYGEVTLFVLFDYAKGVIEV